MTSSPHVLITGGSRGIGLAIAHLFARNNYRCTLLSRSEGPLKAAVSNLNTKHPIASGTGPSSQHAYIAGDISSASFWSTSGIGASLGGASSASEEKQTISVLVNCAGITQSSLFAKTTAEEIQQIVDTNLTSMMIGTRFLLRNRYFATARNGAEQQRSIINVSSLLGTHQGHGAVAYAASKAGVLGFTRALAAELGRSRLRVNAIVPGYVETDMTEHLHRAALEQRIPLGRLAKPEEIASAALFLAQNEYAHNCVINLDGGLSAS